MELRKIIVRLFIILLPLFITLAIYIVNDPFKTLRHYDSYYPENGMEYVVVDKEFITLQNYQYKAIKIPYDAFVFGGSRSMFYQIVEWKKYISSNNCYHFDASGENYKTMEMKFRYLDARGVTIKNALIVLDYSVFEYKPRINIIQDDSLMGLNKFAYGLNSLLRFYDSDFLGQYLIFLLTHRVNHAKYNNQLTESPVHYDAKTNEMTYPVYERMIERSRDSFYKARAYMFDERDGKFNYYNKIIGADQEEKLLSIKKILDKNKTDYKIIINPLFDQKKFDTTDLNKLHAIFGKQNVFDFSGINTITNNIYNFYEWSHYRPRVANWIMKQVYTGDTTGLSTLAFPN